MKRMTATEVQEKIERGEQLNVIDVREVDEVKEGMIPGAIHIPPRRSSPTIRSNCSRTPSRSCTISYPASCT